MDYRISDQQMQALDIVRHQLGFAAAMACDARGQLSCTADEFFFFIDAQLKAVKGVMDAVYQRREAEADRVGMNTTLWGHALRIARGHKQHTPAGAEEKITRALANEAATNPDMNSVLDEWRRVLCNDGPGGEPHAKPLLDARQVCEIYGAKDADGVVAAIVEAGNQYAAKTGGSLTSTPATGAKRRKRKKKAL